jgi:hypothetical protein
MMHHRRNIVVAMSSLAAVGTADDKTIVDYMLVQTARGPTFDKATNTLNLVGISPITLFFSDRPERVAGNMTTEAIVPFWS